MKTKQTIIAALVGGLLVSGAAFAKEKWEFHESDWSGTKSYGNVVLSEDSVGSWGPWAAFEEPAAGMPTQALMPGAGASDPYRIIPKVTATATATDDFCRAGEWCGYAAFTNSTSNSYEESYSETRFHPGRFALTLNPDDPSAFGPGVGSGGGDVSWRLVPLNGTAPAFGDSGGRLSTSFGRDGVGNFEGYSDSESADQGGIYGDSLLGDRFFVVSLPTSNPEATAGALYRYIQTYVSGEGEDSYYGQKGIDGIFVAGIATPQAYLDSQRVGNVSATYSGNSVDGWYGTTVPVIMTVNFGNSTWSGSWNNGRDGSVSVATDSGGNKFWVGPVGFSASGTISGANIASTSIAAAVGDGMIGAGSSVKGTFFGKEAGSIGGVSDIVKTKVVGESVQTASHTAVFLVDKGGAPATQTPR